MRSMRSLSTSSSSRQPRSSVTAFPQYHTWHASERTKMMVSLSSVTSRSAHRLRFVNSNTGISFVGLSGALPPLLLVDASGIVGVAEAEAGAGVGTGTVEAMFGGARTREGERGEGARKRSAGTTGRRTGMEHIERLLAARRSLCLQLAVALARQEN